MSKNYKQGVKYPYQEERAKLIYELVETGSLKYSEIARLDKVIKLSGGVVLSDERIRQIKNTHARKIEKRKAGDSL